MSTSRRLRSAIFTFALVACFAPVKGYTQLATGVSNPVANASLLRAALTRAWSCRYIDHARTRMANPSTRKHTKAA